jgi:hypothetical protein
MQLSTREKCTLRDLIKIEIKSLEVEDYGKYKYAEQKYCDFLLSLGKKLKLTDQQKKKANKLYNR